MTALLEIENLHKCFYTGSLGRTRIPALNGIDLRIAAGESVGIVGESGCGKTTLARCALGLLPPSAGRIRFDGTDVGLLPAATLRRKRREFQIVFQDAYASLNPQHTIREALAEPFAAQDLGRRGERENWIRDLLRAVSLPEEILGAFPDQLSGGQQQRVAIARALALQPRLLVADEPVSALDVSIQAQILNLLADLQRRTGVALILISHSLAVVRHLCARVAVMYGGRIVEEAPADTLLERPKHPYTQLLLACASGLSSAPEFPPPDAPAAAVPSVGCPFHPRCPCRLPVCDRETPALIRVDSDAKAACFLYNRNADSA